MVFIKMSKLLKYIVDTFYTFQKFSSFFSDCASPTSIDICIVYITACIHACVHRTVELQSMLSAIPVSFRPERKSESRIRTMMHVVCNNQMMHQRPMKWTTSGVSISPQPVRVGKNTSTYAYDMHGCRNLYCVYYMFHKISFCNILNLWMSFS